MKHWLLLIALSLGCSKDEPARVDADAAVEEEEDGALPLLDPSKCGTVSEDESPLTFDRAYMFSTTLSNKVFPLFTALDAESTRLAADSELTSMNDAEAARFAAAAACADAGCVVAKLEWDDAKVVAERVAFVLESTTLVRDRLRPSGAFNNYAASTDRELLVAAVVEHVLGVNTAIGSFAAEVEFAKLRAAVTAAQGETALFRRSRAVALAILKEAARDQAAAYEPLDSGENAPAIAAIPGIEWAKYPFAAVVVPGLGPTDASPLAEGGRIRADMAARRFHEKVAPLIVLSGGLVHPDRTKFSEAIEMKRYLVEKRAVPASAIVVDPHARHTTTNLRNASRLLLRYGAPADRPVVINTDMFQTLYIVGRPFAVRCREEIGYEPWRKLVSLSTTDTCMIATRRSLHVGLGDPRDP